MANCYVKAYFDWIEQTAALSDAERGRLFIAVLQYARNATLPEPGGRESILFPVFKATIDRDNHISAVRSESGKSGGEANASKIKQNEANSSKSSNKEKEKEKEKIHKTKKNPQTPFTPPTLAEVEDYCSGRNSPVNAKEFFEFYDAGSWIDSQGKPVRNWKQKLITWERYEPKKSAGRNDWIDDL